MSCWARRLSRDEELKGRWSRYAAIGATIRAEGGLRLNSNLAVRVNNAISAELAAVVAKAIEPVREKPRSVAPRWLMPLGGVALAASRGGRRDPVPEVRVTGAVGRAISACRFD